MKKRIIACLFVCVFAIFALVSCGANAKTFEGKTYTVDKVKISLNSSLSKEAKTRASTAIKTAYGDQSVSLKQIFKELRKEREQELSKVSYNFEANGNGVFTLERDGQEPFVRNFKYEVRSKDKCLVLWFVDENGEKVGKDEVFEIRGNKLVMQASESNMVVKTTFKKSK